MQNKIAEGKVTWYNFNDQYIIGNDGKGEHHKVHIYLEYHSVYSLVRIGTPPPSPAPQATVSLPGTKGGTHSPVGAGFEGVPIRMTGEKA